MAVKNGVDMTGDANAAWTVETLNETVDAEIEALPDDMYAHFIRISGMIESEGLPAIRMPQVRHLEGPLWEMRLRGRDGISRAIYVVVRHRRVVVVRVFIKKTEETPQREIRLALRRSREILQ